MCHSLTGNGNKFAAGKGEDFDRDMCAPEAKAEAEAKAKTEAEAEAEVVYGLLWTSSSVLDPMDWRHMFITRFLISVSENSRSQCWFIYNRQNY